MHEAFVFSVTFQYREVIELWPTIHNVHSLLSLTVRYGGSTRRSNVCSKPRNGTREGVSCASAGIPFIDRHVYMCV